MTDKTTEDTATANTTKEINVEATTASSAEPTENIRGSKAWEGLQAEAARHKREAEEHSKELEKYRQKEQESKEKKALEEGKFKEVIESLKNEKTALETKIYHSSVRDKLREAGMRSSLAINGAIRSAPENADELEAWIDKLKADYPTEFEKPAQPTPQPNPGVPSSGNAPVNWEEVKAWEKAQDRDKRKQARELLKAYREENGKYPY